MHWDCKRSGGRFRSLKTDCTGFTVKYLVLRKLYIAFKLFTSARVIPQTSVKCKVILIWCPCKLFSVGYLNCVNIVCRICKRCQSWFCLQQDGYVKAYCVFSCLLISELRIIVHKEVEDPHRSWVKWTVFCDFYRFRRFIFHTCRFQDICLLNCTIWTLFYTTFVYQLHVCLQLDPPCFSISC